MSAKGFVFTTEALVTLLCFAIFIAALSSISFDDYSDVVLYKQVGDYAQMAMVKHCEHDETCLAELRAMLGRSDSGSKCASVTRTAFEDGVYSDVVFTLCV